MHAAVPRREAGCVSRLDHRVRHICIDANTAMGARRLPGRQVTQTPPPHKGSQPQPFAATQTGCAVDVPKRCEPCAKRSNFNDADRNEKPLARNRERDHYGEVAEPAPVKVAVNELPCRHAEILPPEEFA